MKDYEAFVEIADQVGETVEFSLAEAVNIVDQELARTGQRLDGMASDDRCHFAVQLNRKYRLDVTILAKVLFLPVHVVSQVLRSKRYAK